VLKHIPALRAPTASSPWYVLAELSDPAAAPAPSNAGSPRAQLDSGLVADGASPIAGAGAKLWALRENISEAQKIEGISIKHDIAVPVSAIPAFPRRADAALAQAFPGIRVVAFGHVGDGNLHYNLSKPDAQDNAAFIAAQPEVNRIVHDTGPRAERLDLRRARHRPAQARRNPALQEPGRNGPDAFGQAGHRPAGADESGQGQLNTHLPKVIISSKKQNTCLAFLRTNLRRNSGRMSFLPTAQEAIDDESKDFDPARCQVSVRQVR
jgi:hypothetical protein